MAIVIFGRDVMVYYIFVHNGFNAGIGEMSLGKPHNGGRLLIEGCPV